MRLYRFHRQVAITPTNGPTFYLDQSTARMLAEWLDKALADMAMNHFYDSTLEELRLDTQTE